MQMGASCKTLHIKSALHSPRIYVIPVVTSQIGKQCKPVLVQSFCEKQNFSFSSLQQKSDDRKITKWGTPTFSGIAAIITLLSATNRSVARSCHLSQGEVVHRKL